jgi:hypothetical protein
VRWGCFLVYSTGTTTTATTTPLTRSKRESRGFLLILLRTAATSSLPPPLACKCEVGVCSRLFYWDDNYSHHLPPRSLQTRVEGFLAYYSGWPPRHRYHPPLACKCEVGVFSHLFYWDNITAATPSRLQSVMGVGFPSFHLQQPPRHRHHPLSLANTR